MNRVALIVLIQIIATEYNNQMKSRIRQQRRFVSISVDP